jgi:cytochrome c-type biogenesis protein CcmH/NrfG
MIALVMIGVAVAAAQVMWLLLKRQPEARRPVAVALGVAALGYALTGAPLRGDAPARPVPVDTYAIAALEAARREALTSVGDTGAWLTLAEALQKGGRSEDAVRVLDDAIAQSPRSPDLWIGLGSALFLHAERAMSPAARMAYARGEALAPRRALRRVREAACALPAARC